MRRNTKHVLETVESMDGSALSATQLCKSADTEFVQLAYLTLLRRKADPEGERQFTSELRSGASKPQILLALASSSEARSNPVKLPGLRRKLLAARLAEMPLLRRLASLGGGEYSNSRRARSMRRLENEVHRLGRNNEIILNSVDRLTSRLERLNTRVVILESGLVPAIHGGPTLVSVEQIIDQAE